MSTSILDIFNASKIKEKNASNQAVNFFKDLFARGFIAKAKPGVSFFNMQEVQKRTAKNSPKYTDTTRL